MTFNEFVQNYNLKNKATSNIKIYQVLSSLKLNDVGIFLKNGPFSSDVEILNLHPSKGTHWVLYIGFILIVTVVPLLKNYLKLS